MVSAAPKSAHLALKALPFPILALSSHEKAPVIHNRKQGIVYELFLAGLASSGACIGSNPMEVVKTRMQLQGELARAGEAVTMQYRNFFHGFYTICKHEGLRGIQRGLIPGIGYQTVMNAPRLSLFEPLQRILGAVDPSQPTFPIRNIFAGALAGVVGGCLGSPFYLVKARIQASSSLNKLNTPYNYSGIIDGFRQIVSSEGISGLFRGISGAVPRVAVGSATQLSTYAQAKGLVLAAGIEEGIAVHFASSIVSGFVVTTAMNPFDVISTRLYSQKVVNGKGMLYSGVLDCFCKIFSTEGIFGFYKGWTAHYFRLGPHTVLMFIFWEQARQFASQLEIV